jgi:hypothetical protein
MLSGWQVFGKTPVKKVSFIMPDWHFLGIQQIQNKMLKLDGEKCSQMSTLGASMSFCVNTKNTQRSRLRETLAPPQ